MSGAQAQRLRISYSSSNTYQGCNRRYYYDKIMKPKWDPDYTDNAKALRIGKAFHETLEYCLHDVQQLTRNHLGRAFENNNVDDPTEQGMIYAMVQKYLKLHRKSGLRVVGIELEIGDDDVIGYIDAILMDANGNWWIVDLKTAAKLSNSLLSRLSKDPQLNIYSYYRGQVSDQLKIDPAKFMGVRYRVTTKSTIKLGKKETMNEFAKRVYERIESYDIGVLAKDLNPTGVHNHFMALLGKMRSMELIPEKDIPQNFTNCESYFKPCPYWSRCYGSTFTNAAAKYVAFDSDSVPNLTTEVDDLAFL